MEITIGHACPVCKSQNVYCVKNRSNIVCDECRWSGTFDELEEVKVGF